MAELDRDTARRRAEKLAHFASDQANQVLKLAIDLEIQKDLRRKDAAFFEEKERDLRAEIVRINVVVKEMSQQLRERQEAIEKLKDDSAMWNEIKDLREKLRLSEIEERACKQRLEPAVRKQQNTEILGRPMDHRDEIGRLKDRIEEQRILIGCMEKKLENKPSATLEGLMKRNKELHETISQMDETIAGLRKDLKNRAGDTRTVDPYRQIAVLEFKVVALDEMNKTREEKIKRLRTELQGIVTRWDELVSHMREIRDMARAGSEF